MKIKTLIISLFTIGIVSTSCVDDVKFGDNFLEKAPGVDLTQDTIFSRAEYARRFLWDSYSNLYYALPRYWDHTSKMNMGMFETLSDSWHSHLDWDGVNRLYYPGIYNAGTEDTSGEVKFGFFKERVWETVRACWIFIENVDRVPDMTDAEKNRLKAEAKVIIASRYFDIFRHYGGVPILERSYEPGEDMSGMRRGTVLETTDFMVRLLDEAASVLPWTLAESEVANWDGRMTKAAAMGLKAKVLLFSASPLFNSDEPYNTKGDQSAVTNRNVWTGGYDAELWTRTLKACEDFFSEVAKQGAYGLVQATGTSKKNYRDAYRKAYYTRGSGWDNPEMLISTRARYSYGSDYQWDYYFPQSVMNGAFTPTQEFVDMFPMEDGTPFDWNNPDHVANIFTKRDPRLYETVLVEGADYKGRQVELWVGGREAQKGPAQEVGQYATGYGLYKFILDFDQSRNRALLWPYLRMAEIHLIYAEALTKNGKIEDAIKQVDLVRKRVGLKGLKESNPSVNYNNESTMIEAILQERAIELGFEDVRFFDLIRHKRAADFEKPLHGLRIYRADGKEESWSDKPAADRGPRPTEFRYEKFKIVNSSRVWWNGFDTKWFLSAFPPKEINKDYGLTQNPGW